MATITKEIRHKGTVYRAEVRKEGKRITKRFPNQTLAKQWVTQTEAEIIRGSFQPVLKRHTLAEAIERYEKDKIPDKKPGTQELHLMQLRWFKANFGSLKLHKIDSAKLIEMRDLLQKEPYKRTGSDIERLRDNGTVNRYFVPLSNLFRIAWREWHWMNEVPKLKRLKESKGRTRFLKPHEVQILLRALDKDSRKDLRLIVLIALMLGTRLHETCSLKWDDIDFLNKVISFHETKNSEVKCLPIPESLYQELVAWRTASADKSAYLFPPERKSKRPHVYTKIRQGFARLTIRLGMPDVTFHILRHSVGSWTTQMGVNRKVVGELLGHLDLRTTDRYSHLDVSHLRPVVNQVEALVFGETNVKLNGGNNYEH